MNAVAVNNVDHALDLAARGRNGLPTPADEKQSGNSAAYSNGRLWGGATDPTEITTEDVRWSKTDLGLMAIHQPIVAVTVDDEFRILMGDLSDDELARRVKLRARRNVATKMLADTQSATARQLCWFVVEYVTPSLYSPASLEWLDELILFTRRLLIIANQVHLKLDGGDYD